MADLHLAEDHAARNVSPPPAQRFLIMPACHGIARASSTTSPTLVPAPPAPRRAVSPRYRREDRRALAGVGADVPRDPDADNPFRPIDDAERKRGEKLGRPSADEADARTPIVPVPSDAPAPPQSLINRLAPKGYKFGWQLPQFLDGRLVAVTVRYLGPMNRAEKRKKADPQFTYCRHADGRRQWRMKALPKPRPLFNGDTSAERPDASLMIVEGPKKVAPAQATFPDFVAILNTHGCKGVAASDWSRVKGRHVVIWPDHDKSGSTFISDVAKFALAAGALSVRVVKVLNHFPATWDLADEPPQGADLRALLDAAEPYVAEAEMGAQGDDGAEGEASNVVYLDEARLLAELDKAGPKATNKLREIVRNIPIAKRDPVVMEHAIKRAKELSKDPQSVIVAAIKLDDDRAHGHDGGPHLICNRYRVPISCLRNCMIWLGAEKLRLRTNLMRHVQEIDGRPMTDADIIAFNAQLEKSQAVQIKIDHVRQAVEALANENAYHPVIDWLTSLTWDGIDRVDTFLAAYYNAVNEESKNEEYVRDVSRALLIGSVKRVVHPGGVFRYVPVLIGDQDIGKSLGLKRLFDPWHFSTNSDLGGKEIAFEIQGQSCLEIGDMHAFERSALDAMKNFISRLEDHFRPPWGRHFVDAKRACIVVGTANHDEFLRDETGETRWCPVRVGLKKKGVDVESIARDRDQLFAEAFYRRDESVQITGKKSLDQWNTAVKAAKERDVWQQDIADWVAGKRASEITIRNIFGNCLFITDKSKRTQRDERGIGKCLKNLGYERNPSKDHEWRLKE
jgi:hypothetical protein